MLRKGESWYFSRPNSSDMRHNHSDFEQLKNALDHMRDSLSVPFLLGISPVNNPGRLWRKTPATHSLCQVDTTRSLSALPNVGVSLAYMASSRLARHSLACSLAGMRDKHLRQNPRRRQKIFPVDTAHRTRSIWRRLRGASAQIPSRNEYTPNPSRRRQPRSTFLESKACTEGGPKPVLHSLLRSTSDRVRSLCTLPPRRRRLEHPRTFHVHSCCMPHLPPS